MARTLGHDHDAIRQVDGLVDLVGHEQHGLARFLPDAQQLDLHEVARLRVERRERLVHEQHVGIGGERARKADALLHAAGQFVRIVTFETRKPDHHDQSLGDLPPRSGRHALEFEAEFDIALHRAPRQQPELLEHHGAVGARTGDRLAGHLQIAGIELQQAEQDVQERALAAARRPDDRQKFTGPDVDVEVLQRTDWPAVGRPEGEIDVATLNICRHGSDPRRPRSCPT